MLNRIIFLVFVEMAAFFGSIWKPFYGTLFLLLLIFIRPQDDRPNMQDLHYPLVIMVGIAIGTISRMSFVQKRLGVVVSCMAPFMAILALMWVSALASGYTDASAFQIGQFLSNLVFCAFLVIWVDSEQRFKLAVVALLVAGAYFVRAVLGDPGMMVREQIGAQQFDRVFLRALVNFGNPNYMAFLMVVVIFLSLSMFAVKLKGWQRLAISAALMGYLYVFLKCQSRGATIAFIVGFLVFWTAQKRKALLGVTSVLAVAVGLIFFAPDSYFNRMGTVVTYEEDASAMGRLEFWKISIDLIKEHPLIGIGPSNFTRYASNSQHESYLEIASEEGIPGLLVYIVCLLRGLVTALSARSLTSARRKNLPVLHSFASGLVACVVALIVQGFFTGFSYREFVYTILSLTFLVKHVAEKTESQEPRSVSHLQTFPQPFRPASIGAGLGVGALTIKNRPAAGH